MAENYTKANFCSVLLIKSEIIKAEKIWRAVIIGVFCQLSLLCQHWKNGQAVTVQHVIV